MCLRVSLGVVPYGGEKDIKQNPLKLRDSPAKISFDVFYLRFFTPKFCRQKSIQNRARVRNVP